MPVYDIDVLVPMPRTDWDRKSDDWSAFRPFFPPPPAPPARQYVLVDIVVPMPRIDWDRGSDRGWDAFRPYWVPPGPPPPAPPPLAAGLAGYALTLQWIPFGNREALFIWMFEHAMIHHRYAANLFLRYGVQPPLFDLVDQLAAQDWASAMSERTGMTPALHEWLLAHTRLHQAESVPLNLATPPDLTTVDFRDEQQFYDWMDDHQALHDAQDLFLS